MNPTELKDLANTLNGIADGKPWQSRESQSDEWADAFPETCPARCLFYGRQIRLKPPVLTKEQIADGWVPWSGGECPVEPESRPTVMYGAGLCCAGKPAGELAWAGVNHVIAYKPDPYGHLRQALADGKVIQYRNANSDGQWSLWRDYDASRGMAIHGDGGYREWQIKPEPQWLPLGPEDVPPGSVLNNGSFGAMPWLQVHSVDSGGVNFIWNSQFCHRGYDTIFKDGWQINRSLAAGKWDVTAWEPCRKPSTV